MLDGNRDVKDEPTSDEIAFKRIGGTTRSADAVVVEGFEDKNTLTVSVENYTGSAVIEIIGGRTSRQYVFDVYEVGAEIFDISYLRSGTYTVRITLDSGVYEGIFEKSRVGR